MRLLYVEDNEKLALNTSASLRDHGFAVDVVCTGQDALHAARSYDYDAIVLDRGLPDVDGLSLLDAIKRDKPQIPVIICTARDTLDDRIEGLNAGSDDYLVKPFAASELVARIKALMRRPGQAHGVTITAGNISFDTVDRTVQIDSETVKLTRRELALLELFMRRSGRVLSKDAIENALYSFDEPPTMNAIEVLTHRLRKKLADHGATAEIHNLRGIGYILQNVEQ